MTNVLHKFNHGLGDVVQYTTVLKHLEKYRPEWKNHMCVGRGKTSAFTVPSFTEDRIAGSFDQIMDIPWHECYHSYPNAPSTKAAFCIKEFFKLPLDWDLMRYTATQKQTNYTAQFERYALIHTQGNTSTDKKSLGHQVAKCICEYLINVGITPLIMDWDRRSPLPDQERIFCPGVDNPIWGNTGTGDAAVIAGLAAGACICIGIDSGPQKVFLSTDAPTICIWTGHHPIHYVDNAPNAIHLIPKHHESLVHGNKREALDFFESHYKYAVYTDLERAIIQTCSDLLGAPFHMPKLLNSTAYNEVYYKEHKDAGLDYLIHGDWQVEYGRWLVDCYDLRGKTVLDAGCACGAIACGFAKAGSYVSGVDVSEHMINLGRQKWLEKNLHVCDLCNLHVFEDDVFDFVHSAQVFEHLQPACVPLILDEIRRVMKSGGVLWVALDTEEMFLEQGRDSLVEDPTHICVRPMAWWHSELVKAGWELAPDLEQKCKEWPGSYWQRYGWPLFVARKHV